MKSGLPKIERLKHRSEINAVFSKGQKLFEYPVLLYWKKTSVSDLPPVRVAFSVPKRKFKSAVDRNRIKRQMREAYRLNKHSLVETSVEAGSHLLAMFVYTGKDKLAYHELEKKIKHLITRLEKECKVKKL